MDLGPPTSSPSSEHALLPETKGGGGVHTRLRVRGWGSPNSDDWGKSLALCLLCVAGSVTSLPVFGKGKQGILIHFLFKHIVRGLRK
jgi:hypothetical protein